MLWRQRRSRLFQRRRHAEVVRLESLRDRLFLVFGPLAKHRIEPQPQEGGNHGENDDFDPLYFPACVTVWSGPIQCPPLHYLGVTSNSSTSKAFCRNIAAYTRFKTLLPDPPRGARTRGVTGTRCSGTFAVVESPNIQ